MESIIKWFAANVAKLFLAVLTAIFAPKIAKKIEDWYQFEYKRYPDYWWGIFAAQFAFAVSAAEIVIFVFYGNPQAPRLWVGFTAIAGQIVTAGLLQALANKFLR